MVTLSRGNGESRPMLELQKDKCFGHPSLGVEGRGTADVSFTRQHKDLFLFGLTSLFLFLPQTVF
jgi:hypothetical protein